MRMVVRMILGLGVFGVAACSSDEKLDRPVFERPETAVEYTVNLTGLPNEEITDLASESLAVYRQQDDGAQSLAFLRRRAEGDKALISRILRSRGYYQSKVDLELSPAEGDQPAAVAFSVDPGPPFTLTGHDFALDDPSGSASIPDARALGSPVGGQAVASGIVDAETAAVDRLQREGFPYADKGKRRAVADLEASTIEVSTPISTGPAAVFGELTFEGLEDVRQRYLLTYVPWEIGAPFDRTQLRDYQRALLGTDLFDSVRVTPPKEPPDNPGPVPLPVTVTAEERPFRTVSAGLRFNTDDGPTVTAGFAHRNLFGENETITLEAEIGIPIQTFGIGYREPQYMRPGQDLLGTFAVTREEDDAFDQLTVTSTLGLERQITPRWRIGAGLLAEASQISDDGEDTTVFLGGFPVFAAYDGADDALDPTEGARLRLELTPYAGIFDNQFATFFSADTTGSVYYDVTGEKKYILAGRGRLASILAPDVTDVPQTRRLYAGGGGSVRGYAQRFIGPLDASNDPTGGLSALELGLEARAKLYGDLGGVLFVDAGSVSEETFPTFDEGVQFAGGFGIRYYSPAGPIRVDVAVPLNPRDADDAFQFYFSIGQAF
ncbi:MAG: autotransporter assembly complex family protein [Paracoccaceae bacterium]